MSVRSAKTGDWRSSWVPLRQWRYRMFCIGDYITHVEVQYRYVKFNEWYY